MLTIANTARSGFSAAKALIPLGLKSLKYFVDSTVREQVSPVPGSVLYCDLWVAVEHSGIYVNEGLISNIVVDGILESTVSLSTPNSFTSKSMLGRKIYVSCDSFGSVGDTKVASGANGHVGEQAFYGLVIKNCHQFSTKCVGYAETVSAPVPFIDKLTGIMLSETWEPTLFVLKEIARNKLGANKWRLWDWDNDIRDNPPAEPDWEAHEDYFRNLVLNGESISQIRTELAGATEYEAEIADENIPSNIRLRFTSFKQTLSDVAQKYEEVKDFLAHCPGSQFSYADLQVLGEDFSALANMLANNQAIRELVKKMGRAYISEEKKRQTRTPEASKSEVYGTHRSADIQRLLPNELLNLEDEELETLFYARLLEQSLMTYELSGITHRNDEEEEINLKRTGPIVACLDTSGSMTGEPLLKAKALLLAIANILKQENRSLHLLLFGASGEIIEYAMHESVSSVGLLQFLQKGFAGGTDFETPLRRALQIIDTNKAYQKADVLMISDGDCIVDDQFSQYLSHEKKRLDCSVYSVLCAGKRVSDNFSDEAVIL